MGYDLVTVEPMTGIEPAYSAWEADVLPLNYIGAVAQKASIGRCPMVCGSNNPAPCPSWLSRRSRASSRWLPSPCFAAGTGDPPIPAVSGHPPITGAERSAKRGFSSSAPEGSIGEAVVSVDEPHSWTTASPTSTARWPPCSTPSKPNSPSAGRDRDANPMALQRVSAVTSSSVRVARLRLVLAGPRTAAAR